MRTKGDFFKLDISLKRSDKNKFKEGKKNNLSIIYKSLAKKKEGSKFTNLCEKNKNLSLFDKNFFTNQQ